MADVSTVFDWLALLAIGLMALTIPVYSISLSVFGREKKRMKAEVERRAKELERKLVELTSSGVHDEAGVTSLETEIANYRKDIKKIGGRVDSLSIFPAFFLPFFCFCISLVFTVLGLLVLSGAIPTLFGVPASFNAAEWAVGSVLFLFIGMAIISGTLLGADRAAGNPQTLSAFRVSFDSGSTTEQFRAGQAYDITMIAHNWGKEMAQNVVAQFYVPPELQILGIVPNLWGGQVNIGSQPPNPLFNFPGYQCVDAQPYSPLHEDMLMIVSLNIMMPVVAKKYSVPVYVWERTLGKSKYELIFDVK